MAATPRSGSPAPSEGPPRPPPSSAIKALEGVHPGKVPVTLIGGHAYVWRVQDASRLRVEHHICGLLIGTLPLIPQQNVFLGLPLQLIPEEVVYLLRCNAIILIDDAASFDDPSQSQIDLYIASLNVDAECQQAQQQAASKAGKGAAIQKLLSQGTSKGADAEESALLQKAIAKRKAREEKRMRQASLAAGMAQTAGKDGIERAQEETPSESLQNVFPQPENQVEPQARKSLQRDEWGQLILPDSYQYVTPASALEPPLPLEWYAPEPKAQGRSVRKGGVRVYTSLSSAHQAGVWSYPRTRHERARCAVFESLHEKGYYMGIGLRFGGDFVVYPGDPLRYHSHFTATVKASPSSSLSAMELIANGRLGTAVKKAHLIATCDGVREEEPISVLDDSVDHPFGSVEYFSLTWAGFGT